MVYLGDRRSSLTSPSPSSLPWRRNLKLEQKDREDTFEPNDKVQATKYYDIAFRFRLSEESWFHHMLMYSTA